VVFDLWKHPDPRARANNHSPRTLTVDAHLLDNHPDIVSRIVRRVLLAGQWAEDHRDEAIQYLAREAIASVLVMSPLMPAAFFSDALTFSLPDSQDISAPASRTLPACFSLKTSRSTRPRSSGALTFGAPLTASSFDGFAICLHRW
jgi:ABC-type nitrate/sulfonate/bicarbonate transport system substrate-binding protein